MDDKWYQYVIEHGTMDVYVSLHAYGNRELATRFAQRTIKDYEELGGTGYTFRIRPVLLTPKGWANDTDNSQHPESSIYGSAEHAEGRASVGETGDAPE